jgi:hypothetical protein
VQFLTQSISDRQAIGESGAWIKKLQESVAGGTLAAERRQMTSSSQGRATFLPGWRFSTRCAHNSFKARNVLNAIEERYPPLLGIIAPLLRPTPQWPALARRMSLPG